MKSEAHRIIAGSEPRSTGRLVLWSSMWGGGVAWLIHLIVAWLFAEFGCLGGWQAQSWLGVSRVAWLVLALSAFCLLLALLAAWGSVWCRRRAEGEPTPEGVDTTRFIAHYGIWVNVLFVLVIVAQTVPALFYSRDCGAHIAL
jgi:hypothetical protein